MRARARPRAGHAACQPGQAPSAPCRRSAAAGCCSCSSTRTWCWATGSAGRASAGAWPCSPLSWPPAAAMHPCSPLAARPCSRRCWSPAAHNPAAQQWRRARLHAPPAACPACGSHWRACDSSLRTSSGWFLFFFSPFFLSPQFLVQGKSQNLQRVHSNQTPQAAPVRSAVTSQGVRVVMRAPRAPRRPPAPVRVPHKSWVTTAPQLAVRADCEPAAWAFRPARAFTRIHTGHGSSGSVA